MTTATLRRPALAAACLALLALPAAAAAPSQEELLRLLEKLSARVDQLERRNAELERQVRGAPDLAHRVESLETERTRLDRALDSDAISENEPELSYRLKAAERQALAAKKAAKKIDALDGLTAGASLTTVAQKPSGLPEGLAGNNSQLNYRADITVGLPLAPIGDLEHRVFAHFRIGQGLGLNAALTRAGAFASAPNAVAFRASGANPDDSVAILGQAWYQASIPLPVGGFKPRSKETLELTFGKMDLYGFFDQNAATSDETRQFLNTVFLHNPLLDAGAQVGIDANGFQPGFVASYVNRQASPESWRLSLGVFGTGQGANYERFFSAPLLMAQAETALRVAGLPGNYRVYAFSNGQRPELDGSIGRHSGWGASVDQRFGDGLTVFGRYGRVSRGQVRFDRALTLGAEWNGSYWSRGGDALGLAVGTLRASADYRAAGGGIDLDGDGIADRSFAPAGSERVAELYYRYRINGNFELSPDFQYVGRPGANPDAAAVKVVGLRAQISY